MSAWKGRGLEGRKWRGDVVLRAVANVTPCLICCCSEMTQLNMHARRQIDHWSKKLRLCGPSPVCAGTLQILDSVEEPLKPSACQSRQEPGPPWLLFEFLTRLVGLESDRCRGLEELPEIWWPQPGEETSGREESRV